MERKVDSNLKLIQQGAEAKIFLDKKKNIILKNRISKSYRIPELDRKIIKRRTKAERKLLEKASNIIEVPKPKDSKDEDQIEMPFIDGKKLSEHLNNFTLKEQKEILGEIGKSVAKIHKADIIHGDLTTSNMIQKDKKIYFIDFGLGYISRKIEDKAVDLHLLKQALEAKHFQNWKILFEEFKESYSKNNPESKQIFERIIAIERRGRYRH